MPSTANDWKERRNKAPTCGGNDMRGGRERKKTTTKVAEGKPSRQEFQHPGRAPKHNRATHCDTVQEGESSAWYAPVIPVAHLKGTRKNTATSEQDMFPQSAVRNTGGASCDTALAGGQARLCDSVARHDAAIAPVSCCRGRSAETPTLEQSAPYTSGFRPQGNPRTTTTYQFRFASFSSTRHTTQLCPEHDLGA